MIGILLQISIFYASGEKLLEILSPLKHSGQKKLYHQSDKELNSENEDREVATLFVKEEFVVYCVNMM